jgi:quercetin dioxygenase-like cupin family protein
MNFPTEVLELDGIEPTVDAFLEHLKPLGLQWRVERNNEFGKARATSVFELNRETGEIWAIGALEAATAGKHIHNPGGTYGELVISLAGELNEVTDAGEPIKLPAGAVLYHGPNTTHQASADVFWAGLYHQPRGSTPVK